jgi:hypothetical protein
MAWEGYTDALVENDPKLPSSLKNCCDAQDSRQQAM